MTNRAELRSLAEAATHKDWYAGNAYDNPFIRKYQIITDTPDGKYVLLDGNQNFPEHCVSNVAFVGAANPAAVLYLLDELDAKDNTLLALTTRHFAESWSRRSTDAKLDEYLSAGIAQLQEERDAAFSQHARDSATLRELCQARDDARKERNAALADAKRLRREIKAFRNNSAISHAQMKWLDEILSKEAHNA